jgi:hypothetical protein
MGVEQMKKLAAVAVCLVFAIPAQATAWQNKTVTNLLVDNRACVFFQLAGVAEADPLAPGQSWFALPKSTPNFQEIYAELLSAKMSSKSIDVITDGTVVCGGYASAPSIMIR